MGMICIHKTDAASKPARFTYTHTKKPHRAKTNR